MKKLVGFMVVILVVMAASSPPTIKAHENNTNAVKDNISLVVPEESVVSFEASAEEINPWQVSTQDLVLKIENLLFGLKNSKLATGGAMIKICDVINSDDLCNLFCRDRERHLNFAIGGASERICDTHVSSDLSKAGDIDGKLATGGAYQRIWLISSAINSHVA